MCYCCDDTDEAVDFLVNVLDMREVMRNPQGVWGPVLTRWPALAPAVPKGSPPSSEAKAPP